VVSSILLCGSIVYSLIQQKVGLQPKALEIVMKLEAYPRGYCGEMV
jgi:hypothetical protein